MTSKLNRRSYLASMEDLSDIESDISNERAVHLNSFGKFYEHFFKFMLTYFKFSFNYVFVVYFDFMFCNDCVL